MGRGDTHSQSDARRVMVDGNEDNVAFRRVIAAGGVDIRHREKAGLYNVSQESCMDSVEVKRHWVAVAWLAATAEEEYGQSVIVEGDNSLNRLGGAEDIESQANCRWTQLNLVVPKSRELTLTERLSFLAPKRNSLEHR
jgi:hypothetical protein